jgi:hypothetical protein
MGTGQERMKQGCAIFAIAAIAMGIAFGCSAGAGGLASLIHGPFDGIAAWFTGIAGMVLTVGMFTLFLSGLWAVIGMLDSTEGK